MTFALTRRFYKAITGAKANRTRLQFIPGSEIDIVVHASNDCCDIGITKATYLAIFTEGHSSFVKGYPNNKICCADKSENELWDNYFATIALLCTTNEHMTAWRVHEETVWALTSRGLLDLEVEAKYVMGLATSKFDRINKSLMIWYWIRTLYCAGAFEPSKGSSFKQLMEQVLQSMEAHFCNYAAGFTAAWLMQVARPEEKDKFDIIDMIKVACKENVTDVSLWTLMGTVLLSETNQRIVSDYQKLQKKLAAQGIGSPLSPSYVPNGSASLKSIRDGLLQWLLAIEAPYRTPYEQLLRDSNSIELKPILVGKLCTKNQAMAEVISYLLQRYT